MPRYFDIVLFSHFIPSRYNRSCQPFRKCCALSSCIAYDYVRTIGLTSHQDEKGELELRNEMQQQPGRQQRKGTIGKPLTTKILSLRRMAHLLCYRHAVQGVLPCAARCCGAKIRRHGTDHRKQNSIRVCRVRLQQLLGWCVVKIFPAREANVGKILEKRLARKVG